MSADGTGGNGAHASAVPIRDAPATNPPDGPGGPEDDFTHRARPTFLYVMYALLLWSIPIGLLAAVAPKTAEAITRAMQAYLAAIPEPLYALFGTGYLGYTAAREFGRWRAR